MTIHFKQHFFTEIVSNGRFTLIFVNLISSKLKLIFIFISLQNSKADFFLYFYRPFVFIFPRWDFSSLSPYLLSFISLFLLLDLSLKSKFLKFVLLITDLVFQNINSSVLPPLRLRSHFHGFTVSSNHPLPLQKHELVLPLQLSAAGSQIPHLLPDAMLNSFLNALLVFVNTLQNVLCSCIFRIIGPAMKYNIS